MNLPYHPKISWEQDADTLAEKLNRRNEFIRQIAAQIYLSTLNSERTDKQWSEAAAISCAQTLADELVEEGCFDHWTATDIKAYERSLDSFEKKALQIMTEDQA